MPANLNALIRYKTINSCLYGGRRKWSIDELRERCSEALAESRGKYNDVSERTIRDDIRVMRSDILGFNAPIEQKEGLYYYSDPKYSIFSISITDDGLAEKIYRLFMQLRDKVSHPEMEITLSKLCGLLGKEYEPAKVMKKAERIDIHEDKLYLFDEELQARVPSLDRTMEHIPKEKFNKVLWGDIMEIIS